MTGVQTCALPIYRLVVLDAPTWLGTAINPAGAGGAAPDPVALLAGARAALGTDHPVFDVLSDDPAHQT